MDLFGDMKEDPTDRIIDEEKRKELTPFAILNLAAQGIDTFKEPFKEYARSGSQAKKWLADLD